MNTAWNLVTGTLTKYVFLVVNIALGVFMMPFIVRHLGTSEYGLWMLVASMTYYFQLLDLGYGNGLVRQIADADGRGDVAEMNRVLSTFAIVYSVIGAVAAVGILGIIFVVIPRFPNLTPEQIARAQVVLAILGARVAVGFPMTVFGAATTARQRFALNNFVAIVVALVNGAVTYVVLATGHGLVTLVASTTIVSLASYGAYAWTATQAFEELRIRASAFTPRLVREVTAFSIYVFLLDVGIYVCFSLDNVVLGAFVGTSAVAVYTIAVRLAEYQRLLCSQFNGLIFPVVVRYEAAGRTDAVRAMLVDGTRLALTLVVGVTICLVGFASPLIVHWMGPAFAGSVPPLYFLAIAGVVLSAQGSVSSVLLATGRHRLVAMTTLAEAAANLALSILLVRRFGMWGVAAGTAIPVVVANFLVTVPVGCRQVGVPLRTFIRLIGRPPLVGAIPAVLSCVALRMAMTPESLPMVIAEGFLVGLIYISAAATIGLDDDVRDRYLAHIRRLLDDWRLTRAALAQRAIAVDQ
jgi:O-antigen/teichoic acid export membrane protein